MKKKFEFAIDVLESIKDLSPLDQELLQKAREVTEQAYAPYSHFHVGAAARLANGEIIIGTNQENASYPIGLCAERVLLSAASSVYPKIPIEAIAISYHNLDGESDHPVAPCGICRQSILEYQERLQQPIRLILGGKSGEIFVLENSELLLPFAFSKKELL